MKIQFWSIGKAHEAYIKTGVEDFTKRISRYYPVVWNLIPMPKNAGLMSEMDLKIKEADMILGFLTDDDYLVLLDERGKQLSSQGLADFIQQRANASEKNIIFLIGGAYGIDKKIKQRADFTWALSTLVFPHQLARLILAEQVYRACSILRNEKYHHS